MSVTPDTPTLFLVGTIIGMFMCIMNFFASFYLHTAALRLWSASNFSSVVACLLLFFCTFTDSYIVIILAYEACLLTLVFVAAGVEVFDGNRFPKVDLIAAPVILLVLLVISMACNDNIGQRIMILALAIMYFALKTSWTLLRTKSRHDLGRKACAVVLVLFAMIYLLRGIGVLIASTGAAEIKMGFNGGMIRVFALTMSIAWNFCLLFIALDRKASVDELTGLLNRRSLFIKGNKIVASMHASGKPVSILMMDLDFFKSINDRFGHAIGDAVLKEFAHIVSQAERDGDLSGRLGGEEFCLLLPGVSIEQATSIAKNLCKKTESSLYSLLGHVIKGTVSIGIGSSNGAQADFSALLKQADMALYTAKRQGRNSVAAAIANRQDEPCNGTAC